MSVYEMDVIDLSKRRRAVENPHGAFSGSSGSGHEWRFGNPIHKSTGAHDTDSDREGGQGNNTIIEPNSTITVEAVFAENSIQTPYINPVGLGVPGDEPGGGGVESTRAINSTTPSTRINYGGDVNALRADYLGDPGDVWYDIELGEGTKSRTSKHPNFRGSWTIGAFASRWRSITSSIATITSSRRANASKVPDRVLTTGVPQSTPVATPDSRAQNATQLFSNGDWGFAPLLFNILKDCFSSRCGLRHRNRHAFALEPVPLPEFVINMNPEEFQNPSGQTLTVIPPLGNRNVAIPVIINTAQRVDLVHPEIVRNSRNIQSVAKYAAVHVSTVKARALVPQSSRISLSADVLETGSLASLRPRISVEAGSTYKGLKAYSFPRKLRAPPPAALSVPTIRTFDAREPTREESIYATLCALNGTPFIPPIRSSSLAPTKTNRITSLSYSSPAVASSSSAAATGFPEDYSVWNDPLPEETEAEKFLYAAFARDSDDSDYSTPVAPAPSRPNTIMHRRTEAHDIREYPQSPSMKRRGFAGTHNIIQNSHTITFEDDTILSKDASSNNHEDGNSLGDESMMLDEESDKNDQGDGDSDEEAFVYDPLLASCPSTTSTAYVPWTETQHVEFSNVAGQLEDLCFFFDTAAAEYDIEQPQIALAAQEDAISSPAEIQNLEMIDELFMMLGVTGDDEDDDESVTPTYRTQSSVAALDPLELFGRLSVELFDDTL